MYIYGRNAVLEALTQGQARSVLLAQGLSKGSIKEIEKLAQGKNISIRFVPRIELDQLLKTTNHQGIVADLPEMTFADPEAPMQLAESRGERLLLVLLDQINDPRNYGAIIRSAEVLGAHGVITEERRSAPLSAVAVKASAGASSYLPIVQVKNLARYIADLKQNNVWIYGAAVDNAQPPHRFDWDRDVGLVIGSEGTGLRKIIRDSCDDFVSIAMKGKIKSLNASVAAGILIHSIVHSRDAQASG